MLVQLRDEFFAGAEGFNDRRRQYRSIHLGEDVEARRSPQAVACRKRYVGELGRPHCLLAVWSRDVVDMTGTGIRSSRVRRGVGIENPREAIMEAHSGTC